MTSLTPARTTALFTPLRGAIVVALLGAVSLLALRADPPATWRRAAGVALTRQEADARQQGVPTTAGAALVAIDHDLTPVRVRAATSAAWSDHAAVGDLLLARARLTGSFDDYAAAGAAYDDAFRFAAAGTGPHLERAGWNFAVHRLGRVESDLAAVDRYVVPDDATVAAGLGLRGDLAFYTGHYAQALDLYTRGQARMPSVATEVKLANYHARFGDPDRALALLDQAEARVTGPQQQLRSFIEMRRGVVELGRGDWDAAEAHFNRADAIFPGYWLVEEQRATMRGLRGDTTGAAAIFRRMAARGDMPDALDGLAGLARGAGDLAQSQQWSAKAGAAWDKRLTILPEAALGHALDHLLAFGDPARALDVARRNYALRPYGDAATGLAWAYLVNHRPADALAAIGPTLKAGWTAAEAHVVASEAYALMGRGKEAEAERAAAVAINPHALDRNPGMTWLEQ